MPQPFIVARMVHVVRRTHSDRPGVFRKSLSVMLLLLFVFVAVDVQAQLSSSASTSMQSSSPVSMNDQDSAAVTANDASRSDNGLSSNPTGGLSSNPTGLITGPALSSDQIINILQQNPDLVVELKSQVADRLQEQGKQIDANDISDQMLYSQISSDASTRAGITTFLRAQGYVPDDGLQSMSSGIGGGSMESSSSSAQDSRPLSSNLDAGKLDDANDLPPASDHRARSNGISRRSDDTRSPEPAASSTDAPRVFRRSTPYDLRSMQDLYTQIPEHNKPLKRFGADVFSKRDDFAAGMTHNIPLDVPLGPSYVIGPGDGLKIDIWGSITTSIARTVDRDGHVLLPEAGSLSVAGLSLDQAQSLIKNTLKRQYRNIDTTVTVSRPRTVRVYVVGDAQRPGGYDISSLATPLSALYAAGGPTTVGSLRILRHYRGRQLIEEVDLYDFLLHGMRNRSALFESGDTLLVPPTGPQVAVSGSVKRPAIYELKSGESTLAAIVDNAGGFSVAASLGHITIERIDENRLRETVTLNIPADQGPESGRQTIAAFQVKDGDRIRVEPILPYSQRAIYLEGHVVRPGRLPYTDGMHLSDILHSYRDMLPEPASHAEIVRLIPPDLHAETIEFNVPDVLTGNANINLQPFDTIHIFGRYEVDAPKVTIHGEVLRPGAYPMSKGMTAAQLVRMAGGFKRDALTDTADLTSYNVTSEGKVVGSLASIHIGAAVGETNPQVDVLLKPGDILTVHQITGWNDVGQSVKIHGQVRFPGSYGFQEGERLSSVLRRAGGFLPTSYPMGAVLIRQQVKELEEKSRAELIRQIESNSAAARLSPGGAGASLQLIKAQQDQVLSDLKSHPSTGRMVIHISEDIDSWANTPADIEVRRDDELTIPKRPGFVLVEGQVYNATALTYTPGKTAEWYLSHAGGTNSAANRKEVFIIRANGSVIGRHSGGWLDPSVLSTELGPGDVVVVPQKIIGTSVFWRNLLMTGQLVASFAITAGVAFAAL